MILPIAYYDQPVLRQKGKPVREFDENLRGLFADMVETMHEAAGIGLAAQQIGKALRFCVVDLRGTDPDFYYELDGKGPGFPDLNLIMPMAMANPQVEVLPSPLLVYEEGCLSFPDVRGPVERPEKIRVNYRDLDGNPHELVCDGLLARCILHEADHLNGILFIDRMKKKDLKALEKPIKALKRRQKTGTGIRELS